MTMTRTELEALSTEALLDGFSDCYKELNNVRPRSEYDREDLIRFWLHYDANIADKIEEDRMYDESRFEAASEEFGVKITNWREWEAAYAAHHAAEQEAYFEAEAAKKDAHTARFTKMNPINTIEAWEEGSI